MEKMFRIGITGPSGAGKGALSHLLQNRYSVPVMDADKIYHAILKSDDDCKRELAESFGSHIINDGEVDRKALAKAVFADGAKEKLLRLNEITHKYVKKETERLIAEAQKNGYKFVIVDAPLLIEAGMHLDCDSVICVLADKETRISRITERDSITKEAANARISKQKEDSFYTENSDFTVYNNGTLGELSLKAEEIALAIGLKDKL